VWVSRNAAGYGWFTDPGDDQAFAAGRVRGMDLLTTVLHEFGHVLGFDHDGGEDAMAEALAPGTRRAAEVPDLSPFAGDLGAAAPAALPPGGGATASAHPAARRDPTGNLASDLSRLLQAVPEEDTPLPQESEQRPADPGENSFADGSDGWDPRGSDPGTATLTPGAVEEEPPADTALGGGLPLADPRDGLGGPYHVPPGRRSPGGRP
jgi:hypothetical protein